MPLSRVEITQRNRIRHKVLREELERYHIKECRLFIDNSQYSALEHLAKEFDKNIHGMVFIALREFLANHGYPDLKESYFFLENAVISANARLSRESLSPLREFSDIQKEKTS